MVTFAIDWIDPVADAVSVTFSDRPDTPWSVPVNKADPDSWPQAISDWYTAQHVVADNPYKGKSIAIFLPDGP